MVKPDGLAASYYASRNFSRDKKALDRIDAKIDFDFAATSPLAEKIKPEEFSIRWRGSIIAPETGDYEFIVKTENGSRLWVNGEGKALIDAWVSSAGPPREHRQSVFLLAGRAYPIQLDFFKFKDKTASIKLSWKPPGGVEEVIPSHHLSSTRVPETLAVSTPFPADDASVGYERGTSVSKAWDQATTNAAIEAAEKIIASIPESQHTKDFCAKLAERAFRRPLTPEQTQLYIDKPFTDAKDSGIAVKRSILLILKSPRFLFPEISGDAPDDHTRAARLALALWDSVPDRAIFEAAAQNKLSTRDQIAVQARRMLADPRARQKVRGFLHHWLEMDAAEDISKDVKAFPDFNDHVLADLKTSLDLFLDDVIWSKSSDYRQLMLADYLMLNDRLARFYGVETPKSGGFAKVSFDPKLRSGVLTHPYLLTAFAYHKSSSPIHRGVFLTRNIVGRTLKPPPMAIEFMDDKFDPSLTMREKVTQLTRSNACQSCHAVINPLGFSLEHYDAVGRFRTIDNNKPVDATSDYTTIDGQVIKLSGPRDIAQYAAANPQAQRAFIQQLFNHIVKQPALAYAPDTLNRLHKHFADKQCNVQELLIEIATIATEHK